MKLISRERLDSAVEAVEAGELVVLPTKRWYMICANAQNHDACDRIFTGKGRSRSKALAYVLPRLAAADELFIMTAHARLLAAAFWPGDIAMILPWRDIGFGILHQHVGTPNALVTMDAGTLGELALRSRVPIAATTANFSENRDDKAAGPAITSAEVAQFVLAAKLEVAYCVDGGVCPFAHHLTVVDCTGAKAVIARSGVVHDRAVNAALAGKTVT